MHQLHQTMARVHSNVLLTMARPEIHSYYVNNLYCTIICIYCTTTKPLASAQISLETKL